MLLTIRLFCWMGDVSIFYFYFIGGKKFFPSTLKDIHWVLTSQTDDDAVTLV